MLDLPIETNRLVLRKIKLEDTGDIYAYASDPEVAGPSMWEPHKSLEDSKNFIERVLARYHTRDSLELAIQLKGTNRVVGTAGFVEMVPGHHRAEVGYALSRMHWNKGLATEALTALIDFGFTRLALVRIGGTCNVRNARSARVMEKAGMTFKGILRSYAYVKEESTDRKVYSILRREWMAKNNSME